MHSVKELIDFNEIDFLIHMYKCFKAVYKKGTGNWEWE